MELHSHTRPEVNELADTLHARGLVVEPRADTLANYIPVRTATNERHFLRNHDIVKLFTHFLCPSERLGVEEVFYAPGVRIAVGPPLRVDVEEGQVVRFGNEKFLARGIRLLLTFLGAVEYARNREHRDNGQHFFAAFIVGRRGDEEFSQWRVHWEGSHVAS